MSIARQVWTWLRLAVAALGGAFGWFIGEVNGLVYALVAITVIDFLMAFARHVFVEKRMPRKLRYQHVMQKVLVFVMVGVAHILDEYVLGQGSVLRNAVIFFYVANEGVSILEHAAAMGLPVPEKLLHAFEALYEDDEHRTAAGKPGTLVIPRDTKGGDDA